jgi:hypothetical protein
MFASPYTFGYLLPFANIVLTSPALVLFDVNLATYLSSTLSRKVYPVHLPQRATYPGLTYRIMDAEHETNLLTGSGVAKVTYEFAAYDTNYQNCLTLMEQVRVALQEYTGVIGSSQVQGCFLHGSKDNTTNPIAGQSSQMLIISAEYLICYTESIPVFS